MATIKIAYSKKRDSDLWLDFKGGDRNALDEIFYQNINRLLSYGKRITSNDALIDDCIQEMFLDLWIKRDRLGDTQSIKYYLLKTLRRRILLALKKESKSQCIDNDHWIDNTADFKGNLESNLSLETETDLNRVFQTLTPTQKEVIYLKFYNNLSFDEISLSLDLTKKVLYNCLSKAMMTFRREMKDTVLILTSLLYFI